MLGFLASFPIWIISPSSWGSQRRAALLNGQTTIAVAHGCSYTPSLGHISIVWGENPTNVIADWWIDTITATHFTLNGVDPGASNLDFGWAVRKTP